MGQACSGARVTSGLTLDTGALLALERGDVRVRELLGEAAGAGVPMSSTPRCPGLRLIVV